MIDQRKIDYERIENAIHFIRRNFKSQPSLDEIAEAVHVSPFHFQRMFSEWVGVSPKKFMQYISLNYAKTLLKDRVTLMDAAYETGLSGTSRLHDLFVNIEGMTPGEYKNGGANLALNYCFSESPFGKVIVASTHKGVCHMFFEEDEIKALNDLRVRFPNASFQQTTDKFQQNALSIFQEDWKQLDQIKLHLAGTPFQLKVWESLLKIPVGRLSTYGDIAQSIDKPKASRAVGTAIGSNPVAFLIPCHRVIQNSGKTGGYMWGPDKKTAIIGWEAAKRDQENI
ncbi:MAG: methylated-DNA--[protein]-cysteine S-methyltransferase [Pirellulaceae bacterium]|nr:methylated-DNA--[protein]-cysteine S-methyltransferase [Pirellulaceae bacterium]